MDQDHIKERAKEKMSAAPVSVPATPKAETPDIVTRATDTVASVAGSLRETAAERTEAARDELAEQGQKFAASLRAAAADHGTDSLQGRVLGAVAGTVDDLSDGLRGQSIGALVTEAQSFARRNPGVFVAGAALAGFALARFARSSARGQHGAVDTYAGSVPVDAKRHGVARTQVPPRTTSVLT